MGVTLSLAIVGTDEDPRWAAFVKYSDTGMRRDGRFCCDDGHWTPEAAAAHGLEISAAVLVAEVRSLQPPAIGALALARAAA